MISETRKPNIFAFPQQNAGYGDQASNSPFWRLCLKHDENVIFFALDTKIRELIRWKLSKPHIKLGFVV